MPNKIIAFMGTPAASRTRRRSSAVNSFAPRPARGSRNVFLVGPLNPGPNRTGAGIRPASKACLNIDRMCWMVTASRCSPHFFAISFLERAKSCGSRSATSRALAMWATIVSVARL